MSRVFMAPPGGMQPKAYVLGASRQGDTVARSRFPGNDKGEAAYERALEREAKEEARYFDWVDQWRKSMSPFADFGRRF